jgi:LAO/AO transport system kinase
VYGVLGTAFREPVAVVRRTVEMEDLLAAFGRAEQRALARAITRCESGEGEPLIGALFERAGRAMTIGLTGPPGVGKSTLTAALVAHVRRLERTVGVISVDPSSPFSHGALLGDRIRLTEHFVDQGVFIRSMASRGHLGGVAGATADAVTLMDAFGYDVVIVETVGVGQSEIEIAEIADTILVALQPGSGDTVQMLKAGILEIADVFVVNKRDHPMALQLQREIRSMMEMLDYGGWVPKLVATQAIEAQGVDTLWDAIVEHDAYLRSSGEIAHKRRSAYEHRVRGLALGALERRVEGVVASLPDGRDPYGAARDVLARFGDDAAAAQAPLRRASVRASVKGL